MHSDRLTRRSIACERGRMGPSKRAGGRTLGVVLAALAAGAWGCGNKSNDAPPPPPADQPEKEPATWAANAGEVTRFADEVPFGPEATISGDKVQARKSPGSGGVVSVLASGTNVTKLAAHGDQDLVCFDDPKGGAHLIGWVPSSSLQDAVPPPAPGPSDDAGPPDPPPRPHKGHHHGGRKRHP
jgi:hypothetical protein